jgi:oxygen-independent coproporphyrinogen-3 oxidase
VQEEMKEIRHVYAHVPYCHRICPYCGFYKHRPGKASYGEFADALAEELRVASRELPVAPRTLYFGGGTPSLLPTAVWRQLVADLGEAVDLAGVEEWTLEANPRTFDAERARAWAESGVTRVSLGVQAFDPPTLETLGRDHGPEDVADAVAALRRGGIPTVNIDLMFSVPGQTLAAWEGSLEAALELGPDHVSTYNLTYEEDTDFLRRFESGEWTADTDRDAEYFVVADRRLGERGFVHYEVSNFSLPGRESLHNRAYWAGADYLGLGPSAVSTVDGARWKNVPDTAQWARRIRESGQARTEEEILTEAQRRLERLALQLRTDAGVPLDWVDPDRAAALAGERLAEVRQDRFVLTLAGMMVADEIAGYVA